MGFDETFLHKQIASLLTPVTRVKVSDREEDELSDSSDEETKKTKSLPIKAYPKLGKFLRILTIMMIQNSKETLNRDQVSLSIINLLDQISYFYRFQEPVPYDQINLCIEIIMKQKMPLEE